MQASIFYIVRYPCLQKKMVLEGSMVKFSAFYAVLMHKANIIMHLTWYQQHNIEVLLAQT